MRLRSASLASVGPADFTKHRLSKLRYSVLASSVNALDATRSARRHSFTKANAALMAFSGKINVAWSAGLTPNSGSFSKRWRNTADAGGCRSKTVGVSPLQNARYSMYR